MADDEQKTPPSDKNAEDAGGLEETTGQIEDDATRQITGDALQQIRESAGHDMAPEWLEKMRERKREAEKREDEDFDTPVPDAIQSDGTPATAQMDPDEVGSLTAGMEMSADDSDDHLREGPKDSDTTELERDATKAINRGELDTLMKEREADVGDEDSNATSERPAPGAGVISKASKGATDRPTREVDEDASSAVAEADAEAESTSSSSFSLPKPGSKSKKESSKQAEDGLDEDSFGDFSDEDLHAVVFGEGEEGEEKPAEPEDSGDEQPADNARVEESPALDFSDISAEDEDEPVEPPAVDEDEAVEPTADDTIDDQPHTDDEQSEIDAPDLEPPDLSLGDEDVEAAGEDAELAVDEADDLGVSDDADVEPPEEFPDYDQEPKRPAMAAAAGFLAALIWIVGGALAMFTSMPSPWESLVPPIALGAGIVAFLLVLVGPPKWIEASILAVLGIGIGGFAFVQWSNVGSINVSDYLGMAPLVGGGLAIVAAIMTLIRPSGQIEEL